MPRHTLAQRKTAAMALLKDASTAYWSIQASIDDFVHGHDELTVEKLQQLHAKIEEAESDGQSAIERAINILEGG